MPEPGAAGGPGETGQGGNWGEKKSGRGQVGDTTDGRSFRQGGSRCRSEAVGDAHPQPRSWRRLAYLWNPRPLSWLGGRQILPPLNTNAGTQYMASLGPEGWHQMNTPEEQ